MSDDTRFARQQIIAVLQSGRAYTLYELQLETLSRFGICHSECALSARLRDLRNKWGLDIRRERVEGKSYCRYWLEPSKGQMRLIPDAQESHAQR
jgi:hypothetical protein